MTTNTQKETRIETTNCTLVFTENGMHEATGRPIFIEDLREAKQKSDCHLVQKWVAKHGA